MNNLSSISAFILRPQKTKVFLLFCCIGLFVFGNTLSYPFIHDDKILILANPAVTQGAGGAAIFLKPSYATGGSPVLNQYYRPLLEIFNRIQFVSFGQNPFGFHLVNVALHILNALGIFLIVTRLAGNSSLALFVGLIFLVHSVQSEAVASIAGQSNTLGTFLLLNGFYCYFLLVREKVQRRRWFLATGFVLSWLAALLVKEQAVILPFLIAAALFLFCSPHEQRKMRPSLLTMAAVLVGYALWRKYIVELTLPNIFTAEVGRHLLQIPRILGMYIGILFWPQGLHYYRSINVLETDLGSLLCLGAFIVLSVLACQRLTAQNKKLFIFGLVWFVLGLLPILVIPIVNEYAFVLMFEHFAYLPLAGLAVSIWVLLNSVFKKDSQRIALVALGLIVLSGLTVRQNMFWQNERTLFERAVFFEPKMGRLRLLLGEAYYNEQKFNRAQGEFDLAINIFQSYLNRVNNASVQDIYRQFLGQAYALLAQTEEAQGNDPAALKNYQQALTLSTDKAPIYNNLGMVFVRKNDVRTACEFFGKAVSADTKSLMTKTNWGVCLAESGKTAEAKALWQEVLTQQPNFLPAKQNLERLLKQP